MDIFESLENLNVSEECFEDIVGLVEMYLSEDIHYAIDTYAKTDKKGRDALHKKAEENKEKAEEEESERSRGYRYDPLHPDKEKEYEEAGKYREAHPLDRIDNRSLRRHAKKHGRDVDKANPNNVYGATGLYYGTIQKEAGQRGKKTKNEKGEEYTKQRSAEAKENMEKKGRMLRDLGMSDLMPEKPNKKFKAFKKSVEDYANSLRYPKKSAEDKSIDRYNKKHPKDYGDYESPWA